jgi:Uncharacterized protein conserved in bacteria
MPKNLYLTVLLDFYGNMLTKKQKDVIELYYNDDLSLSEISENEGITRQGVRDSIKRAEMLLTEMEEKLGLAKRFNEIFNGLDIIIENADEIEQINSSCAFSKEIHDKIILIKQTAQDLSDNK